LNKAPALHAYPCIDAVCLSPSESQLLSIWIAEVDETRIGLEGCPLVQLVDE
jgi:hypothetical protein